MNIEGLDYNTHREQLILPEYGREVQKMVDHAVALPTKEQRQQCANTIIGIMERMAEGKIGGENIPLNYNNGGFIYTFSENAELLPEDVKAAAQAALNSMIAAPNTVDFSGIELK